MPQQDSAFGVGTPETQRFLSDLATAVRTRRLEVPAIFLLELCKPLSTVAYATSIMSAPLLHAIFGGQRTQKLTAVLESRENIEALIVMLEQRERAVT